MSVFSKLFKKTLTYKTYDLIRCYYHYRKNLKYLKPVFYGEDFKKLMKNYLNVDLDKDWLGRLYGVVNPNINGEGKFDVTNMIIEIDGDKTNNNDFVNNFIYKQLNLIGRVYNMKRLYENIDIEVEHVGPEYDDNYLLIFDIVSRKIYTSSLKTEIKQIFNYIIIGIICIIGYMIIF